MKSSDYRKLARENLKGRWQNPVLMALVYVGFFFAVGFVEGMLGLGNNSLANIINTVIQVPILYGFVFAYLKFYKSENVDVFDFISIGFSNFKRSWAIALQTFVKLLIPFAAYFVSLIITIVGFSFALAFGSVFSLVLGVLGGCFALASMVWLVMQSYYYKLANKIAIENPEMSSKDVVEKSKELMMGKRGSLFVLELSFIGWAFLCIFTLGIGMLWLIPYMEFSQIAFYKALTGDESKKPEKKEEKKSEDNPIENKTEEKEETAE